MGQKWKQWQIIFSWAPKSLWMVTAATKKSYDKPRQYTKKQRHYFANKGPYSQSESESEVAQSQCPTLCDPMDCSLPGSSVYGIFQARVLEWVAISFSRGSSQPRDRTQVSCTAGRYFTVWATREAYYINRRPVFPGFLFKGSIKIWSLEPNYII